MDEAQVKALIAATLDETLKPILQAHSKALLDDVSAYVDNRTEALEAHITTPNTDSAVKEDVDADSPVAKRLALVEKELQEAKQAKEVQDKQNALLSFKTALNDELGKVADLQHSSTVAELLYNRYVDGFEQKDNGILLKDGKTLSEGVTTFMGTDEGRHFLKPVQVTETPGLKPPVRGNKTEQATSLAQALLRSN